MLKEIYKKSVIFTLYRQSGGWFDGWTVQTAFESDQTAMPVYGSLYLN